MIAMQATDKCYSTIKGGLAGVFNTDGVQRDYLDPVEVRSALDFEIVKKPSFDEMGRRIPGHYHLVRSDNNAIIPSAGIGEKFTPVNHFSVYDYIINDIKPKVPGMELETVGTLHGSGTGIIAAKIGSDFAIRGDNSPNEMRLMFSNPCNGLGSLVIGFTTVRLFCQNQIAAARRTAGNDGFSIHHTKNAELHIGSALKVIAASIDAAKEIKRKSENLASVKVDAAFMKRLMDRIYPFRFDPETHGFTINEHRREEVLSQFEGGETAMSIKDDTAWKVFNAFSYPIFNPQKTGKNMDRAEIAYTGAVGSRATAVRKIFDTVYDEAMRIAA